MTTAAQELVELLDAIDPEELEKEALSRLGAWGETSYTKAFLDVLKEWVGGL